MKTRFLTVFKDQNTTGLLLENDRGIVVGRTSEDPLTLKAMHISQDRKAWDEVKKCYGRNFHNPQSDVDFLTENGKKVFKTAEECLSYDLMQRFGVETLDEVAQLLASAVKEAIGCNGVKEGFGAIKPLPNDHGTIQPAESEPPIPDFKVAQEQIFRRIEAESLTVNESISKLGTESPLAGSVQSPHNEASPELMSGAGDTLSTPPQKGKAKKSKPAGKVLAGETMKKAIEDMQSAVSRGGLTPAVLAKRLNITEESVMRIVADRDDLFIARDNGKIYKA